MTTLHITNAWHSKSGGVATFYRALLSRANRQAHRIRLVAPTGGPNRVETVGEWARIYHVHAMASPFDSNYRVILPHKLRRILREEKPDLIEICDKHSLPYAAACLRSPYWSNPNTRATVIGLSCERMDDSVRNYLTASRAGLWLARTFMKRVYFPAFDHHVTVSPHTAEELMAASRGHKMRRGVWILPMGVDVQAFRPSRRRATHRRRLREHTMAGAGAKFLLYAGRLAPEKNLDLLIDVMERLKALDQDRFHLIVAGDGPKADDLRAAAARRVGGRVTFLGHVSDREALADLYANVDVFAHTNPREPFGIAPLEAMASGTPVVLPKTGGGASTYANTENCWPTEPTAAGYASAILEITGDPAKTSRRTERARQTAEEYSWEKIADSYLQLYREIHALRTGQKNDPAIPPAFYSSEGNWLGQEI